MPTRTEKRPYNSTRRTRQAAQTRHDVLRAATALFDQHGWAGTTLAAIAEEAGVSVETIYKGFGSKKALLREAIDVAVVGDAEPLAYVDRPVFASLAEGSREERIARGVAYLVGVNERCAGVVQALFEAASSDEEVDRWRRELEDARFLDTRRSAERILGRAIDDHTATLLWLLYSPSVYRQMVIDGRSSRAEYEQLILDASQRLIPG